MTKKSIFGVLNKNKSSYFWICVLILLMTGYSPPDLTFIPDYYYELGLEHEKRGSYSKAIKKFKIATRNDPNMAEAHLALGAVYLKTGEYDKSEEATTRAIVTLPRSRIKGADYRINLSVAYNNMGAVEELRTAAAMMRFEFDLAEKHLDNARGYYTSAVEVDSANKLAISNLRQLAKEIIR